ncbi:MAG: 23S rRNA (pseudouridine(1915)-N(3))-methyltransferase RlmH [Zetaproteobacteria bacterium]|nr:MAG: 23S rRNA (pseudouridine(1915)-N(3))-methyltransferase RlmH [Zetaproteobacteria bacterium]
MKLRLIVVGKGAVDLAAYENRFLQRLKPVAPCSIHELPEGRAKQPSQRLQEEARYIRSQTSRYILFDEQGRSMSSRMWADFFARQSGGAIADFVIGGSDGVNNEIRSAAEDVWSLSKLTLPHQLARVLFLEQSYRALMILRGHPYHHA